MIFASAGNDGIDACSSDIRYIEYSDENVNDKHYPASFVDVIAIGGMDNYSPEYFYNPDLYSNYGSCVDFFAPYYADAASISNENKTEEIQDGITNRFGTSFSTPIVTGVAATLISEHPEITFNQDIIKQMLIDLSIKGAMNDLDRLNTPNRFINIGKQVVYSTDNKYKGCGIGSGKRRCPTGECCSAKGYCSTDVELCEIDCQIEFGQCSANNHHAPEKSKKESEFRDALIFNYYSDIDMCVKLVPSNDISENVIMTVCNKANLYNVNNIWKIANEGDNKISGKFNKDTCILLDENGLAYADSCENSAIFKDIMTVRNKDSIQSDAFPGKCLKAVESDYDPYGITIFTERRGVRVMMGDCDPSDITQHWRFRDIPEPSHNGYYFNDGFIDDDFINNDYIEEESEFPSSIDTEEEEIIYDEEISDIDVPVEEDTMNDEETTNNNTPSDKSSNFYGRMPYFGAFGRDKIIFDRYGQFIDLNEYIKYNIFKKSVVTSTKSVWIYNEELNLCLELYDKFLMTAWLQKCEEINNRQLWYVPDNNKGYFVNVGYDDTSIIYIPMMRGLIFGIYEETIIYSFKKYVKNHSSVITYEDDQLKIYDKFRNEEVCIDVPEEEKSKEFSIRVNVVPCSEATTHWKLTTEYPVV